MWRLGILSISLVLTLQGCAVVKVTPQARAVSLIEQRDSILTRSRLSEASISVLSMTGQDQQQCLANLSHCEQALRQVPEMTTEQYLSTLSELYLADGLTECSQLINRSSAPNPCLIRQQLALLHSIRHAYAYLFFSNRSAQSRVFDNRQVQVRDFYNLAVSRFVQNGYQGYKDSQQDRLSRSLVFDGNTIYLNPKSQLFIHNQLPEQLIAADDLGFKGLRAINRRDGFGVEFVAVLPKAPDAKQIYQSRYLPVSLVLKVRGNTLAQVMQSQQFDLDIYNPFEHDSATLSAQQSFGLATNYSAPYGLWLAQNNLAATAYRELLGRDAEQAKPRLYMLEPYNPNKRVVLLIHGLASSPEAWISLTNDVLGDPILREGYQVWQVFYPTNMPILESRYQIHQMIRRAFAQVDPKGQAKASSQAVLIGHSMGGVISRLLMSPTDLSVNALDQLPARDRRRLTQIPDIKQRFKLDPLPQVGRVVFLSSPFRGTDYADRWFTLMARRIIQIPKSFVSNLKNTLERAQLDQQLMDRIGKLGLLDFQNGASELSHQSRFMQITADVKMKPNVPFHLIMGQRDSKTALLDSSDGIVSYRSSHLDGAVSEKVIKGGHSIQETPEAVLELRRILRLHVQQIGDVKAQKPVLPALATVD
jgi:pimeloyl-ACP methyl ester carboxylesterase